MGGGGGGSAAPLGFADVSTSDEPSDVDATSSSVVPCDGSLAPTGDGCSTVG